MQKSDDVYDVCIIGASIAGNYLTHLLSDSGLSISIIEEHKKVGYPLQCAGIVSQKLKNLIQIPEDIILNRVKVAKIVSPLGKELKLSGDENPFIIDRIALDKFFFQQNKKKKGIDYFLGEKFKHFEYIECKPNRMIQVNTSKRKIKTKMLIGCDGPLSRVAKLLNIQNKIIYAKQVRVLKKINQNEASLYFDELWNDLFGWIVPEGNNICRIGLASSNNIQEKAQLFFRKLNLDRKDIINAQGGLIPIGLMNQLAFENILLLGDAACQVKATTGGGIIMLLIASKYAAICIKKAFNHNNFSKGFIKKYYENPCRNHIGNQLKVHYLIRLLFQNFANTDFQKFFEIIEGNRIKSIISIYGDMDFPKIMLIKLLLTSKILKFLISFLLQNPKILFKIIKILLR